MTGIVFMSETSLAEVHLKSDMFVIVLQYLAAEGRNCVLTEALELCFWHLRMKELGNMHFSRIAFKRYLTVL